MSTAQTDTRPEIKLEDGLLPQQVDEAIAALVLLRVLYVYAGRLSIVITVAQEEHGDVQRPAGASRVHYVDSILLTELLTKAARFLRYDRRAGEYRTANAPRRLADHVLARADFHEFPQLDGVIDAPTIDHGEVVDRDGYHSPSRLFLSRRPTGYRAPPLRPTFNDAEHALQRLQDVLASFAFETEADKSAGVAALITPVVRRTLPAAPAIGINSPAAGTGKTLLARCISELSIGRQATLIALTGDDGEDEKRLAAGLLAGDAILLADNLEAAVTAPILCSMATEPELSVRILGRSELVKVPTNISLIFTGNGLQIVRDMRRRTLLINLNAGVERPEERVFGRDPVDYIRKRRGSLIRDTLTVVRAYQEAGEPHVGTKPFGSFEAWDRMVRRPLVWLGLPDPLDPAQGLRDLDPDVETTRSLFHAWREVFGTDAVSLGHAIATARQYRHRADGDTEPEHPTLKEALQMAASDKLDSRRLAAWMRRHRERIVDGMTLRQAEDSHLKVLTWAVVDCGVVRS